MKNLLRFLHRGGLVSTTRFVADRGRIPLREPPCPGEQVGEGNDPSLDAAAKLGGWN
jgi:hypothetical protein